MADKAVDRIVPAPASDAFFQNCGSKDKTRLTYPSAFHNLWLEPNREEVFGDMLAWLSARAFR
jgi:alpha-beta hydrolase superfamily lysophospholipase